MNTIVRHAIRLPQPFVKHYEGRGQDGNGWSHDPLATPTSSSWSGGDNLRLAVSYIEKRKHLPIIELRQVA